MAPRPISEAVHTYRGVVHAHTCFSGDGHDSIADFAARLRQRNLNFVILSDHAEDFSEDKFADYAAQCRFHSSADLILIPGLEYTFEEQDGAIEVLLIGEAAFVETTKLDVLWTHKHQNGLLAILPHPAKFRFSPSQVPSHFDLIETWNRRYDGAYFPPRRSISFFCALSKRLPHIHAVSGVDYHEPGDALDLVTVVHSAHLAPDAVIDSLRRGTFHTEHGGLILPSNLQLAKSLLAFRQVIGSSRTALYRLGRWVAGHNLIGRWSIPGLRRRLKQLLH